MPLGAAHALHVGHLGTAEGRVVRGARATTTPARCSTTRPRSGGFDRRRAPRAARRCTTRRRSASAAARCSPAATVLLPTASTREAVSAAIAAERPTTTFMVPAHLQRLFAQRPALPDLVVVPARSPTPARRAPSRSSGRRHRRVPRRRRLGVLRLHRGPVHRLLAGRVARRTRAPSAGPGPTAPSSPTTTADLVRGAAVRPLRVLARPGARPRPRGAPRTTPSRSATSAGSTTTATCTSTAAATT